uniref:Uncharacterized protein n=1 Tax=Chromera velia CCMP2878 TaxID=1169474 RepID=A0A0G4HX68_9ALVE|eukprot:Cvel_9178.t1-p1 / transcript=Cvel_9178.t1 / gene=Cvel_9178 / organism=Chromera_velia_CCMP2878 / gene_product=Peptidyl-prolyl cis-trans isomerase FKBP62, putative / transcript_product=Peptidyl-prolyl cis-trans isomerase FKBP62, putative / location=Cvel_scaffold523:4538-10016(-) / protein_length=520 / sequence_SO=supercontig / SO=protein_coding / is_pseudo=false
MCTSSQKTYDMANRLVADFLEDEEAWRASLTAPKKGTSKATGTKTGEAGPSRQMGATDYGRFEALAEELQAEEQNIERKKKEEADMMRQMWGCSHDHAKERQIFEKPTSEKIKAANRFREEGNRDFQKGHYAKAAVSYRKALLQFDYTFPDTEEETEQMKEAQLAVHLNMAACKLHMKDWDEVHTQCRMALELDPKNVKGFYRKGLAYLETDDFDSAENNLMGALENDPQNAAVKTAIRRLKEKREQYKKMNKQVYSAMFASSSSSSAEGTADEPPQSAPPEVSSSSEEEVKEGQENVAADVVRDDAHIEEIVRGDTTPRGDPEPPPPPQPAGPPPGQTFRPGQTLGVQPRIVEIFEEDEEEEMERRANVKVAKTEPGAQMSTAGKDEGTQAAEERVQGRGKKSTGAPGSLPKEEGERREDREETQGLRRRRQKEEASEGTGAKAIPHTEREREGLTAAAAAPEKAGGGVAQTQKKLEKRLRDLERKSAVLNALVASLLFVLALAVGALLMRRTGGSALL